ncbi:ribonuclease HepT family protein [Legionella hackeliae]|uniref:Uncharacterized protein n=1 Tax=Legionella hackeliae TaxID=449 RepID=A0A0A8UWQ7_LEGHA|nr:hypothetical protein [Legionella hackeliae]KTD13152.1 hypothetical protein Lhac_1021 [Legionella hackeliae]CEK11537.1 protein of unknown function [coiled-coil domain] [Legionella hackeliae]STX48307.1 Uncharacterised protein [Legionella hackeliae]
MSGYKKELIQEIKALAKIEKLKKIHLILNKIEKNQYGKALLIACKNCKAGDKAMLRLVKLICRYKNELNIDINYSEGGMSFATYAAINANVDLFLVLDLAGLNLLNPDNLLDDRVVLFGKNAFQTKERIKPLYKPEFLKEYEELNSCFENSAVLPKRTEIATDTLNANFDLNRIEFIIQTLNFIKKYQRTDTRFIPLPRHLKSSDYAMMENEQMEKCRLLIEKMCVTIQNFSYELRGKFSGHFEPAPFTWMTFDQFGGVVREPPLNQHRLIPLGDLSISALDFTPYAEAMKSIRHILRELADRQDIIEEAVYEFIDRDLPVLLQFFATVGKELQHPSKDIIKPVSLKSVKALTSYISDLENLIKLLNLVNYTQNINPLKNILAGSFVATPLIESRETLYKNRFNLSTKRGKHAALHHLEMIGELITGKNFSQFLCKLDNTIDWRAFIAIRDGIVHQDAGTNMHVIKQLTENLPLFEKILGHDLSEFFERLVNLMILREGKIGAYNEEPHQFWRKIMQLDAEIKSESENDAPIVDPIERRISVDDERIFVEALAEKNAPPAIIDTCVGIFSGTRKLPDKKELGEIIRCLPSRSEDRERNKLLVEIINNAIKKPSLSLSERNEKRELEKTAREQREMERRLHLKGLVYVREFAEKLHKSEDRQHLLTPRKRVMAAYDALLNIKEFLVEENYLTPDLTFQTIVEWDEYHTKHKRLPLAKLLEAIPELNDAIEYNAAQFLQHLDTIRDYNAAAHCHQILQSYGDLRRFRNYLEHGDPLYDYQNCQPNHIFGRADHRQQLTAPMFIKLVLEVLPEFKKVVDAFAVDPHLTPLVTPEENEAWTLACGGYKTNGFFSSDKGKPKEDASKTPTILEGECHYY